MAKNNSKDMMKLSSTEAAAYRFPKVNQNAISSLVMNGGDYAGNLLSKSSLTQMKITKKELQKKYKTDNTGFYSELPLQRVGSALFQN